MAEVASAYVTLIPRFDNLSGAISKALGGAYGGVSSSSAKAGKEASRAFGNSFLAGGALGVAAAAVSKAVDAIGGSLGSAISRVDTMNNFPRVMESLGFSAEGAQSSIDRMASRIDGLPTSLNGLVSMTQRLTATTGDLDYATTLSIALNDALLAGGASTVDVERALVQYTQALAKGKPEMEDWRTLQEVMPGQLNAIAKAMMGAEATSNDLYQAMKDGEFSMDDFNAALIRLDNEGMEGMASFEQQARNSTKGIATALTNVGNRASKAVAQVIDAIGAENIAGAIDAFSSKFSIVGAAAANAVGAAKRALSSLWDGVRASGAVDALKASLGGLKEALSGILPDVGGYVEAWAASGGAKELASKAVGVLTSALDKLTAVVGYAKGYVRFFLDELGRNEGMQRLADLAGHLGKAVGELWDSLKGAASALGGLNVKGAVSAAVKALASAVSVLAASAYNAVSHVRLFFSEIKDSGAVSTLGEAVGGLADAVKGLVSPLLSGSSGLGVWKGSADSTKSAAGLASSAIEALAGIFDRVSSAVSWASAHMDQLKPVLAGVAGAIGGVAVMAGPVANLVGTIRGVAGAVKGVGGVLSALAGGPVGIVAGALAGLAAAFGYLYTTNEGFRAGVQAAWGYISGLAQEVWPLVQGAVSGAMDVARGAVDAALPAIKSAFDAALPAALSIAETVFPAILGAVEAAIPVVQAMVEAAMPVVQAMFETAAGVVGTFSSTVLPAVQATAAAVMPAFQTAVETVLPVVQSLFETAMPLIKTAVETAWPVIRSAVEVAMAAIQGVVQVGVPLVQALFEFAMPAIQNIVETVFPAMQATIETVMGVAQSVVSVAMDFIQAVITVVTGIIQGDWAKVWDAISTFLSNTWETIKETVSSVLDRVWEAISSKVGEIKQFWTDAWENVKSVLSDAWESIKTAVSDGISGVVGFVTELPGKILDALGNVGGLLFDAGSSIISGFLDGLKSMWDDVTGWFAGIGDWIVEHKGPPSYDAVMLVKNGQLIMGGLNKGLSDGWGETRALLQGYTEEMARAGESMGLAASFEASAPVARSSRAEPVRGAASASVVIQNMNINARDLRDVKTVEQFSARVLGRELAVL